MNNQVNPQTNVPEKKTKLARLQSSLFLVTYIIVTMAAYFTLIKDYIDFRYYLGIIISVGFLFLIVKAYIKKRKNKKLGKSESNAFIFPDETAKKMKELDLGIQYETSVISSAGLIICLTGYLIYNTFFGAGSWMMKTFVGLNLVFGLMLMASMLVTYYQQLVSYRDSIKFLVDYKNSKNNTTKPVQPVQKKPEEPIEQFEEPVEYYEEPEFVEMKPVQQKQKTFKPSPYDNYTYGFVNQTNNNDKGGKKYG